jgi:GNAT superfamily N-acetyltransferase
LIRPFTSKDYPALIAIANPALADDALILEEARYNDEHRDPLCKFQRWLAELDGIIVGAAEYDQDVRRYHPRKFTIHGIVNSDYQRQGIGSALYQQIVAALEPFNPLSVQSQVREDRKRGVQFLKRRGFHEAWWRWESRLDVMAFDPAPYSNVEEQLRIQGIEIKTFRQLETDPGRNSKLYALENELVMDVPTMDERTPITYDSFMHTINSPYMLPNAYFVALCNNEYVGVNILYRSRASNHLQTGLTGVKRAYRHRGIATALKLCGIAYAKEHGYTTLRVTNDSINKPMLAINERLGFVRRPAWITLIKVFAEEPD